MRDQRFSRGLRAALTIFTAALFLTCSLAAAEKKLHNFGSGADGTEPQFGNLTFDHAGNLYGLTTGGGNNNGGTVFEMTPNGDGTWTEKKLHNFGSGKDGAAPECTLVSDGAGNFYGTTYGGGDNEVGTVFELTPNGSGGWTETKLHNFGNGTDGAYPYSGVILDAAGNLYGATFQGGDFGEGTVYELSPNGSGGWSEKKLHNFDDNADGTNPAAALIFDAAGNLYGTTVNGGDADCGCGTVFELMPNARGGWTERKLHSFGINGVGGAYPYSSLVFDAAGNLYGTTSSGGNNPCGDAGCGTVFELSPNGSGGWSAKTLHNFGSYPTDATNPFDAVVLDSRGNLYGTTEYGGNYQCAFTDGLGCGAVFELTPNGSGGWTERNLHNFGSGADGINPFSGLILDTAGNLFGTTQYGGGNRQGTVFEITP